MNSHHREARLPATHPASRHHLAPRIATEVKSDMVIDRVALRRTVAVINGKGGVGKTSLVANLGWLLPAADHRVLRIDLDPQGNPGEDRGYTGTGLSDDARPVIAYGLVSTRMRSAPLPAPATAPPDRHSARCRRADS